MFGLLQKLLNISKRFHCIAENPLKCHLDPQHWFTKYLDDRRPEVVTEFFFQSVLSNQLLHVQVPSVAEFTGKTEWDVGSLNRAEFQVLTATAYHIPPQCPRVVKSKEEFG